MEISKKQIILLLILTILSVAFISIFSPTTSPLFFNKSYLDSTIFQVFGKNWAVGGNPYVTVWDQKGPIIYFINMLGYWLFGSKLGVCFFQILSLSISLFFVYKFLQENFSNKASLILTFLSCFALLNNYSFVGNCVEEYLLPLLVPAYWLMYKWTKQKDFRYDNFKHPVCYAFVYGMVLAFSLLTRLTNALGVCGASLFILFFLIKKRSWRNLILNILSFTAGFFFLFLPFALYFIAHGTFGEMWYATFTFNVDYAKNAPQQVVFSFNQLLYFLKSAILCIVLAFISVAVLLVNPSRRLAGWLWLVSDGVIMVWLLKSNGFNHYFIITFPFYCIILNELHDIYIKSKKLLVKNTLYTFPIILFMACTYEIYGLVRFNAVNREDIGLYNKLRQDIGENKQNTFLAYNEDPFIYLYLDRQPAMRFFAYQSNYLSFSPTLLSKLKSSFSYAKPNWVLVGYDATAIEDMLKKHYIVYKRYGNGHILWRKKIH